MAKKLISQTEAKKNEVLARLSPFAEPVDSEITSPAKPAPEPEAARKPRVFKVKQNLEPPVVETPTKKRTRKAEPVDPFLEVAEPGKEETTKPLRAKSTLAAKGKSSSAAAAPISKSPRKRKVAPALEVAPTTSPAKKRRVSEPRGPAVDLTADIAAGIPQVEVSPVFKALADVKLPELKKEDRARLLLQSPTKVYFYWSVRENPWQRLRGAFGSDLGSYTLVVKLIDLSTDTEAIYPADVEGEHWFDVEPDGEYQAEIGFYAPNRPYFRIVYSNKIVTPRRSPSPHPASDARWTVSANKFAEVLDVSGFTRDAFDVALAGDDVPAAAHTTHLAFSSFVGGGDFTHLAAEDLRCAMLSLAAGVTVDELRDRVGPSVYNAVKASGVDLTPTASRKVLKTYFDIDDAEWSEEEFGAAVHGASLMHFPKTLKTRAMSSRYNPIGSHSVLS